MTRQSDRRSKYRHYVPVIKEPHIHCNCEGCGQILRVTFKYLKERNICVPTTAVIPGVQCARCLAKAARKG
jgi:hypothetical protein